MAEVSFWDRRRAAVRVEEQAEALALAEVKAQEAEAVLDAQSDDAILAKFNLPDPDTLKMGDDFSAFMVQGIPTRLRNRALRNLWRSNPVLACVDGLNDYDDDYLTGSTGNGVIATTYKVGKGLMAHIDEMARQAKAKEADDDAQPEEAPEPVAALTPEDQGYENPGHEEAPEPEADTDSTTAPTVADSPAPRRMRFHFDDGANA